MSHRVSATDFFAMTDRLSELKPDGEHPEWFPTRTEIDELLVPELNHKSAKKGEKMLAFALWLSDREPPNHLTPEQRRHFLDARQYLRQILNDNIKIVETKETDE